MRSVPGLVTHHSFIIIWQGPIIAAWRHWFYPYRACRRVCLYFARVAGSHDIIIETPWRPLSFYHLEFIYCGGLNNRCSRVAHYLESFGHIQILFPDPTRAYSKISTFVQLYSTQSYRNSWPTSTSPKGIFRWIGARCNLICSVLWENLGVQWKISLEKSGSSNSNHRDSNPRP